MEHVTLASVGLREREHLQAWVSTYPEIVGRDLLLITSELDQWEVRDRRVADRLDVLFLDSDGAPLVAELKRDAADDTTELQALKYAAYCSQLTVEDVVEEYARSHGVDKDEARRVIVDHAPSLQADTLRPVRVRLVAGSFGPSVAHVVLWLVELGLDIGCIEVAARRYDEKGAVITVRQLLPPAAAEDYFVRRRRRQAEEDDVESRTRRRNSVTVLDEAGVLAPGDALQLNVAAFSQEERPKLEEALAGDASLGHAQWTGEGVRKALRWLHDGEQYSCSGLVENLRKLLGMKAIAIAGPDYWLLTNGKTMYEFAIEVDREWDGEPEAAAGHRASLDAT